MDILQNRYQVEQQLGKKAGRQTVLARDLKTQELVVIKLLTFGVDFEWDDLKLFEREAETLRSLNHPAIPNYLDYFEIETTTTKGFAIVQSYIDAKSLEQHLKAGRSFTETDVKQLAESLLDLLTYLHTQQPSVIHRDIKPSNILLGNRTGNHVGQVYLVDFGSVQTLVAQEGGTLTVVGTYGYMPPEQYGGRATPASDLYSLGATLIFLITGKHPADLPQRNLQLQFRSFATLSEPFLDWLEWLTEPSLENRLGSAQVALRALQQGQLRLALPEENPGDIAPQMTTDRLFWNAIWRSSAFGAIAGVGCVWVTILPSIPDYALLEALSFWGVVCGGLGLGLGFLNGLLVAFLTHYFDTPEKTPLLYRLIVGIAAMIFSGAVVLTFGISILSMTGEVNALKTFAILALPMVVASQAIATWYLRERRRTTQAFDVPQKPRNKIQAETLDQSLVPKNEGKLAPPMTTDRILWNAIWRFGTVGASVSTVLFAVYAKFSMSYSGDLRMIVLNMIVAAVLGGSLGLGLGFFNGIVSGLLTRRSKLKNVRLYRLKLGMLSTLCSAGIVAGFFLLLSASWIPVPLFVVMLSLSMGATSQSFIRWYLREIRKLKR
ncbi:serine/threonine protein kinase [Myxacorys almedinensis]|uniref:Protein kinase n=1 Tax=Myxacorys almedinensis A TaxID=2690445 RepID=A0A8J8CJW4_9CYAN|nr:serine/threonine-protein kinase [Myxacorys almedinensis]NDJ15980.1 protein kinase [Myxacorys almedinensis A]